MGGDESGTGRSGIDPMYSGGGSGTTGVIGYNPSPNWWQATGKGLGGLGSAFSQGTGSAPQFSMPSFPGEEPINTAPVQFLPIMAPQTNTISMDDIIQMLAKLGINV
jgi:hypothetical protein